MMKNSSFFNNLKRQQQTETEEKKNQIKKFFGQKMKAETDYNLTKKKKLMTDIKNEQNQNIGLDNVGDGIDQILESSTMNTNNEINTAVATKTEIEQVINNLLTNKKIPKTQANFNKILTTTAHLVQIGATSPKFAATRIVSDYGLDIKVGDLREACSKTGITVRKYARGIRDTVIKVAQRNNIEGNLAKGYKLENPDFDRQDLVWVSDFQTFSENPSMPENVRTWLLENYKNRFRPNS